jgi:protein-disulfide isomerase
MSSSNFGRSRLSVAIALSLAFASLWAASGCKSRTAGGNSTPAASASGSAAATGPCAQYADKVCAKAGAESPTCSNFKEVTGMMSPAACTAGLKDIQVTLTKLAAARGDCEKLVKTLCAAVGPTTKTCNMVTTQTQSFPPARCKQMMEHIPQITEDLKKMEAANQPLSPDLQAAIATGGAAFGPENSKVKLVEFSDFECPYCSRAATVVHQIKEKYGDKFPLPMHSNARGAAEAALAANAQGKFWEFHDELFKNQQALGRPQLEEHAKKSGLNMAEFKKSLDEKKFGAEVDADMKLGEKVSVQGTPTMFLNGARVENPTDFTAIAALIDAALAGTPPG